MNVLETTEEKCTIRSIERFFPQITDRLCELNIKDEVKIIFFSSSRLYIFNL